MDAPVLTGESGQSTVLVVAIVVGALGLSTVGFGVVRAATASQQVQAIADVAALAAARDLWAGDGAGRALADARQTASLNGATVTEASAVGTDGMPRAIRLKVRRRLVIGAGAIGVDLAVARRSSAAVVDLAGGGLDPGPGDYFGPFAWRQGKPMRPDVALAFDRLAAAARRVGVGLTINSAWRSSSQQAALFRAHPDPTWVAPPGKSLHRLGTELDLGPAQATGWLAVNAPRFGFIKRYSWEPWHFGYARSPGSRSVGFGPRRLRGSALQAWVPLRYRSAILDASRRRGVGAALLAAQIRAESDFKPNSVSSAGATGISQLMPDEAARFHVDPFSPPEAIDAQARLMRELLARFASVPLALAAYNAGPGVVGRCGCIPPYPETQAYVRRILGWLHEAVGGPIVRLTG